MAGQTKNERVARHTQAQARTAQTVEFTIRQRYQDVDNCSIPAVSQERRKA